MQHQPVVTRRAAFGRWARSNWKTTVAGVVGAAVVVLGRAPERIRWQDVAIAVLVLGLGLLGKDPDKLLVSARGP